MIKLRDNDRLNFNILAPMASADGYGYSAEELVRSATRLGANIGFVIHDWKDEKYTGQDVRDLEVPRDQVGQKEVFLVYFIPYAMYQMAGQANFTIGQTMFETTEIPDIWAWCINEHTQGLIVPSEFCRETFAKKVNVPIEVAPLGVNVDTYPYLEREHASRFTFIMAGSLHYRKGAEFTVRAFKREFDHSEPVRLILKTRKGFFDIGSESIDGANIDMVDCDYTRTEMLDLYHAGDCFVAPSRGEASGLTPREAMATGMPAIVTDWSGLSEIADPQYSYPVGIESLENAPAVCSSYDQGITQGQSIGQFCKPSIEELQWQMRYAYEHQEENLEKGRRASQWISREWNYDLCAQRWLEAIERIYDKYSSTTTSWSEQRAFSPLRYRKRAVG